MNTDQTVSKGAVFIIGLENQGNFNEKRAFYLNF